MASLASHTTKYHLNPKIRKEERLNLSCFFRRKLAFFLPIHHPAIGIKDAAVKNNDVVLVAKAQVQKQIQGVPSGADVVNGRGARNVADDLGAFLRTPHAKIQPPEKLIQFDNGRGFSRRRRTRELQEKRPRNKIAVITDICPQKSMDPFRFGRKNFFPVRFLHFFLLAPS